MNRQGLRVASYRFRATFGQRWGGYLVIVLLVGLVGGIAMGSIGAARRTQSSFPSFLASTNPSDLVVSFAQGSTSTDLTAQIAHLPGVKHVESFVSINAAQLAPDGRPVLDNIAQVGRLGSVDGLYFNQDRLTVVQGRMADPKKPDELVMTAAAAKILGLRVGQVSPWGFVTNAQTHQVGVGPSNIHPAFRLDLKLVGLVVLNHSIVQDDVDRLPTSAVFTPALTASLPRDWAVGGQNFTYYGIQLAHGARDVGAVEQELHPLLVENSYFNFHPMSLVKSRAERAVKPESIAVGAFGGIAGIAALLIAAQAISRQFRAGDSDLQVLRALGAGPSTTTADGLIGVLSAVVLGSLLAAGVAVGLSPLSPLGPARGVYPGSGIGFDWTVIGGGLVVLAGGLGAVSLVLCYRAAPHRVVKRARTDGAQTSNVLRLAAASGLRPPGLVGVRFALEPGDARTAAPARSALLGATLTVVMVVATLTFGSGLRTLVARPALFGWNWGYALTSSFNVPPQARALLDHDPYVAAWTGLMFSNTQIDGHNVPILLGDIRAAPAPPILLGHGIEEDGQIVLGAATLAQLHKHVGDTVVASGYVPPTRLVIVGTATLPAIGQLMSNQDHPSMGVGALVPRSFFPPDLQQSLLQPDPTLNGPNIVLVRLRKGVTTAAGRADMQRIADVANRSLAAVQNGGGATDAVAVQSVQHPAEIVNYRRLGSTPAVLDAGLVASAVIALALTLAASVRRRRRDLALLKAIGFTTRQLAATVAWQASVAAVVGIAVGIPLGVAVGRWLWILFARSIFVVPRPTVPVVSVVVVAAAALVLANVVAAFPGHVAARTPTAVLLRAE